MLKKLSDFVSIVFNPFLTLAPVFVVLFITGAGTVSGREMVVALTIGILFGTILPAAYVFKILSQGRVNDWDIGVRELRDRPLKIGTVSYLIGFILMDVAGATGIPLGLMFCYVTNTLLVIVITRYWKISIHALGIAGPLMALQMAYGAAMAPLWVLLPIVAGARVYLKRHTVGQVAVGALVGGGLTYLQIQWIFL